MIAQVKFTHTNIKDLLDKFSNMTVLKNSNYYSVKQSHERIAEYYGLHKYFDSVTCVVDKCEPDSFNGKHTDLKDSKHCITTILYCVR